MRKGIIKFDQSHHWYLRNDEGVMVPQHDATLREARKQGLYASPSSIEKAVWKNDFLDMWKQEQMVIACVENQRMPHESVEEYAQRVYDISGTKARDAAMFGKRVHKVLEDYPAQPETELMPWFSAFQQWFKGNFIKTEATELVLADHDICVAGTTDLVAIHLDGRKRVVDYKTQGVKTDDKGRKKPVFYDSWKRQLAFYSVAEAKRSGMFPEIAPCISVILDSNPDAGLYVCEWEKAEILSSYEDFLIGAFKFFKGRSYWPQGVWSCSIDKPKPI